MLRIEETSRQAVGELHLMLGILRKSEPGLAPSPSLRRVGELVEQVRGAGLETTLLALALDAHEVALGGGAALLVAADDPADPHASR